MDTKSNEVSDAVHRSIQRVSASIASIIRLSCNNNLRSRVYLAVSGNMTVPKQDSHKGLSRIVQRKVQDNLKTIATRYHGYHDIGDALADHSRTEKEDVSAPTVAIVDSSSLQEQREEIPEELLILTPGADTEDWDWMVSADPMDQVGLGHGVSSSDKVNEQQANVQCKSHSFSTTVMNKPDGAVSDVSNGSLPECVKDDFDWTVKTSKDISDTNQDHHTMSARTNPVQSLDNTLKNPDVDHVGSKSSFQCISPSSGTMQNAILVSPPAQWCNSNHSINLGGCIENSPPSIPAALPSRDNESQLLNLVNHDITNDDWEWPLNNSKMDSESTCSETEIVTRQQSVRKDASSLFLTNDISQVPVTAETSGLFENQRVVSQPFRSSDLLPLSPNSNKLTESIKAGSPKQWMPWFLESDAVLMQKTTPHISQSEVNSTVNNSYTVDTKSDECSFDMSWDDDKDMKQFKSATVLCNRLLTCNRENKIGNVDALELTPATTTSVEAKAASLDKHLSSSLVAKNVECCYDTNFADCEVNRIGSTQKPSACIAKNCDASFIADPNEKSQVLNNTWTSSMDISWNEP